MATAVNMVIAEVHNVEDAVTRGTCIGGNLVVVMSGNPTGNGLLMAAGATVVAAAGAVAGGLGVPMLKNSGPAERGALGKFGNPADEFDTAGAVVATGTVRGGVGNAGAETLCTKPPVMNGMTGCGTRSGL